MEIFVGEKEVKEYIEEAKKNLKENQEILIKGKGRDTVKAVDTAEMLKREGFNVEDIKIDTLEEDERRISIISIKIIR